jgi:atypical dual specificity phosphatase
MADTYSNLWWAIDGVLAGMGMPFVAFQRRYDGDGALIAFEDDLPILYRLGIRGVVCLLNITTDEPVFRSAGFEFLCLPVDDGQPPTQAQAEAFVRFVDECRSRSRPVAVFCEAGLGRTGTMIAAYFVRQGESAQAAIASVRARQPGAIETRSQIHFLQELEAIWKREPHDR